MTKLSLVKLSSRIVRFTSAATIRQILKYIYNIVAEKVEINLMFLF
jgi:hypothetical protein